MVNDQGGDAGFVITKPVERKLEGFARRLRLFGKTQGATSIGAVSYEIQVHAAGNRIRGVDGAGYTILSINGKRNPCLEES